MLMINGIEHVLHSVTHSCRTSLSWSHKHTQKSKY